MSEDGRNQEEEEEEEEAEKEEEEKEEDTDVGNKLNATYIISLSHPGRHDRAEPHSRDGTVTQVKLPGNVLGSHS